MRPDPLSDTWAFLTQPVWPVGLLWVLLGLSVAFAGRAIRRQRPPAGLGDIAIWLARVLVGGMWWQQSMGKVPPSYGGLLHGMGEMVDHAAVPALGAAVRDGVIPRIEALGPLVYLGEVAVATSLILGVATRLGALLGLLMALTLWLGVYSAPGEWPWAYGFLVVVQALWVVNPPGASLGVDALVAARRPEPVLVAEEW